MKKTKTWSEIKHMAHVSSWSQGQYGAISCSNILCFIDFNDKICFKIKDETRKSKYNKKTKSIETKTIKPSLDFSNFINLVKRKEDTYETELIMKNINTWLGKKVDYEKYKRSQNKKEVFLKIKLYSLSQRKIIRVINCICLPSHINFPSIGS